MPVFWNSTQDSLIRQENRLTKIESTTIETRQMIMGGLGIMLFGAYLLVKNPIDALTKRLDIQNGRVTGLEYSFSSHQQQSKDKNLWGRIEELENWRDTKNKTFWMQDGIALGKSQIIAIFAGLAVGLGSTAWAVVQIFDKIFPQGI